MNRAVIIAGAAAATLMLGGSIFAQDAKQIERGKAVYAEQKCKMCHSIAGEGNAKGPLEGVGAKYNAEDMAKWMTHPKEMTEKTKAARKPPMKAYPNLPKEDLDALVAYMMSLKK
jgi:cytochrome c551/c552